MTYKDKIKEEIERRMNNLWYLIPEGEKVLKDAFTKDDANNLGKYTALENLLQFIDSLPEEPKCIYNRTLEERKKFCKYCSAACDVRIEEELVGEDLEEEIKRCWNEMFPIGWSDTTLLTLTHEGHAAFARHYAEWQEKKMLGIAEAFYEQGRFEQKQEMIKDAVEGEYWDGSIYLDNRPTEYKDGDKVKIIIVKSE